MNEDKKSEVKIIIERLVLLGETMNHSEARHIDEAISELQHYLD